MEPLTDVRDISRIAYGFIASKALFAALELDMFSRLVEPKTIDALVQESGIPAHRVKTLLATLTVLGLIVRDDDRFRNVVTVVVTRLDLVDVQRHVVDDCALGT